MIKNTDYLSGNGKELITENKTEKCPETNKKEVLKGDLLYMKPETWKENRSDVI